MPLGVSLPNNSGYMLTAVTDFGRCRGHKELVPYQLLKIHLLAADPGRSLTGGRLGGQE